MNINELFSSREKEIFSTLKLLRTCEFVIIGGYAVNAYTLPRFSVDCDIVIRAGTDLGKIRKILIKNKYSKINLPKDTAYLGDFARYEKRLDNNFKVSIDILIKKVIDRQTGVSFSAEWVFAHSSKKTLKGKTIIEELLMMIIDIDALIVMKIISCRATDIRDIFMMLPNAKDISWIRKEIQERHDLKTLMTKILLKISSKQFRDGLAGVYGQFDSKTYEKHKKIIEMLGE
jgi:hypothetical protein